MEKKQRLQSRPRRPFITQKRAFKVIGQYLSIKKLIPIQIAWLISIPFCMLALSIFFTLSLNVAQASDIKPFQAEVIIQRTDCEEWEGSLSSVTIGFMENYANLTLAPPPPPGSCLYAYIDPYSTESDGFRFLYNTGYWGWKRALLPIANVSATWGVKIQHPGSASNQTVAQIFPLRISWDADELADGLFQLYLPQQEIGPINMHEQRQIEFMQVQDNPNYSILKIDYRPYSEEKKVYTLIFVGGTDAEQSGGRLYNEFSKLSMTALRSFKRVDIDEELLRQSKYITYDFYPLDIDQDGKIESYDFSFLEICQKERLRQAITDWLPKTWKWKNTESSVFFLYIIDHGNYSDGSINIDPLSSIPSNRLLSGDELNSWLCILENKLQDFQVFDYELVVFVEACYSGKFIDQLKYACDDSVEFNPHRILISSTDEDSRSKIIIDVQNDREDPNSFSKFFFNKLFRFRPASSQPYTIGEAYKEAANQINPTQGSGQRPQFYPDENAHYQIDDIPITMYLDPENEAPVIKDFVMVDPYYFEKIEPEDIQSCYHKFYFKVTISNTYTYDLRKVILDIFYSNQNNGVEIQRIENVPYKYEDNITQWFLLSDYCFCYPGTYKLWVYVEGEKGQISIPYSFQFKIPELDDIYEPDNSIDQAGFLPLNNDQSHFLSDSNDIDWMEMIIDTNNDYLLKITPLDQSLDDPNIFRVKAFKIGNEAGPLELINLPPLSCNNTNGGFYFYTKINWEIIDWSYDKPCRIFLKLFPGTMAKTNIPYNLEINDPTAGDGFYSFIIRFNPQIKTCLNITDTNDPNSIFLTTNAPDTSIEYLDISWLPSVPNIKASLYCNFSCTQDCSKHYSLWIHNILVMEMDLDKGILMFDFPLNDLSTDFDADDFTNDKECTMGTDPLDPNSYPIRQSIQLQEGWNLISFQIGTCLYEGQDPTLFIPDSINMVRVPVSLLNWFSEPETSPIRDADNLSINGDWQRIISFDPANGAQILDKTLPPFVNTLRYFAAGYGYWIKMNKPGVLVLEGVFIPGNTQLTLNKGWNLIGLMPHDTCYGYKDQNCVCPYTNSTYTPEETIAYCKTEAFVYQLFRDIEGKYKRITSFDTCNGAMFYDCSLQPSINTLDYIGPKYGFWIKMEEEGILTYPNLCHQQRGI